MQNGLKDEEKREGEGSMLRQTEVKSRQTEVKVRQIGHNVEKKNKPTMMLQKRTMNRQRCHKSTSIESVLRWLRGCCSRTVPPMYRCV